MESATLLLLLVLLPLASADTGLSGKALLFPQESANSYVRLIPLKPLSLDAFTLCMRLSVDSDVVNQPKQETILFAYQSRKTDELNVWQERGKISFYLSSSEGALYSIPLLSVFRTNLCLTWESSTGLAAFWVDGKRSTLQVYKRGHRVQSGGVVLLGQNPDVGEITDVNMWDSVLTGREIRQLGENEWTGPTANVLNWDTMKYEVNGNVIVVPQKYY